MRSLIIKVFGDISAENVLVQMIGDHEISGMEQEYSKIRQIIPGKEFRLIAVKANNWNEDLSPWKAPSVFGQEDFGNGAEKTLYEVLNELLPDLYKPDAEKKSLFLGGYSLAGLFSLWSAYQCDAFSGVAAVSPSVWFPGFTDYIREASIHTDLVYLSLGDREERTKNPVLARVGNAIRDVHLQLQKTGTRCVLEWNSGNHFTDPGFRMAKAFGWLLAKGT